MFITREFALIIFAVVVTLFVAILVLSKVKKPNTAQTIAALDKQLANANRNRDRAVQEAARISRPGIMGPRATPEAITAAQAAAASATAEVERIQRSIEALHEEGK